MSDSFRLSRTAARGLARDHDRLRSQIYGPQPVRLVGDRAARSPRKNTAVGLTLQNIPALGAVAGQGDVNMLIVGDDGGLTIKPQVVRAFSLFPQPIPAQTFVELLLDWDTGRWLIVTGPAAIAVRLYFVANESFTFADASFSADIVAYFGGTDPRPIRWDQGGSDTILNPLAGAAHFFQGDSGFYGYATWHDEDSVDVDNPVGWWCEQIQCAVAG